MQYKTSQLLKLLLSLFFLKKTIYSEEIIHKKPILHKTINIEPRTLRPSAIGKIEPQISKAISWRNMRIVFDYTNLETFSNSALNTQKIAFAKKMLETVKGLLATYTQTKSEPQIDYGGADCAGSTFPNGPQPVDLYVAVRGEEDANSDTIATAGYCFVDLTNARPVAGIMNINLARINLGNTFNKQNFAVLLHETFHILGFSGAGFKTFVDTSDNTRPENQVLGTQTIGSTTYTSVVMDPALEAARDFFGCNSVSGLPMENAGGEGTAGSHWETTYFVHELMNPYADVPTQLSELTISTMRYSNWYKFNSQITEPYVWGKGDGCQHFTECPNTSEYCTTEGALICSEDFTSRSLCETLGTSECRIHRAYANYNCIYGNYLDSDDRSLETIGIGSSCFLTESGSNRKSSCYRSTCNGGGIDIIFANGSTARCTTSGQVISQGSWSITCPDIGKFCQMSALRCPFDCNNKGVCLINNKCHCYSGETGMACNGGVNPTPTTPTPNPNPNPTPNPTPTPNPRTTPNTPNVPNTNPTNPNRGGGGSGTSSSSNNDNLLLILVMLGIIIASIVVITILIILYLMGTFGDILGKSGGSGTPYPGYRSRMDRSGFYRDEVYSNNPYGSTTRRSAYSGNDYDSMYSARPGSMNSGYYDSVMPQNYAPYMSKGGFY